MHKWHSGGCAKATSRDADGYVTCSVWLARKCAQGRQQAVIVRLCLYSCHTVTSKLAASRKTTTSPRILLSLRQALVLLGLACSLPAVLIASLTVYEDYRLKRDRVYQATVSIARSITVDWEREIHGMATGLQVLAASEELSRGDLHAFHAKARQIAQLQDVDSYTLVDSSRMQILNTKHEVTRPAVPASAPEETLNRVFSYRSVAQTDLFKTATNRYLVAISVPVVINDDVRYSLQVGISPEIAGKILRRQALGEGWVAALLDSQGIIAGRTRDEERFIGQPAVASLRRAVMARAEDTLESTTKEGISVFTAFTHTLDGKWTVAVGAPTNVLLDELTESLVKVILAGAAVIGLGVALAVWMARAIERSIAALIEPAVDLGRGGAFVAPPTHFVETAALGAALTETSQMLARAQQMAYHDPLTGLCNRVLFGEVANQILAAATRASRPVAILAIDLDHFKEVNDTQGHAMGDIVLKSAAQRMKSAFRASDIIARFGGDEFFVLMDDANVENALAAGNKLVKSLSERYPGVTAPVGASVGISVFPVDGRDLDSLLAEADAALYAAKNAGRGRALHRSTRT